MQNPSFLGELSVVKRVWKSSESEEESHDQSERLRFSARGVFLELIKPRSISPHVNKLSLSDQSK